MHSRLIGAKGKSIAKVMEQFQVDVRFPKDKNSNVVTIQGLEENVEDAKYHLLTLAEDYVCMLCIFVHVCVCVHVCMCMHMCARARVCTCACVRVHCICMCVYMCYCLYSNLCQVAPRFFT